MKIIEQEDRREQDQLRAEVERLQAEVEKYSGELLAWRERSQRVEKELDEERQMRPSSKAHAKDLRPGLVASTDAVPLPPRRSPRHKSMAAQGMESTQGQEQLPTEEIAMGCGNCSTNSRCDCIEQAFDMENITTDLSNTAPKRAHSPFESPTDPKRYRRNSAIMANPDVEMEIDFTTKPAPHPTHGTTTFAASISASGHENLMTDPCGFCSDGTPCICTEMAFGTPTAARENLRTGPSLMQCTPPPSDSDVIRPEGQYSVGSSSVTTPASNTCTNGPGTCAQCQADPHSTLFCKSLASTLRFTLASTTKIPDSADTSVQSCGNPGGGGCCRVSKARDQTNPGATANTEAARTTVTCADAFTSLSRHPAYERASAQLGEWLPQLHTTTTPLKGREDRTAYEIESASVLGVLRFFDRRFGKEG